MNRYDKSNQPDSIPEDPSQPRQNKPTSPPNLSIPFQPPNLSQFNPREALRTGTLWKPLYDPYFNPHERVRRNDMAWQTHSLEKTLAEEINVIPRKNLKIENAVPLLRLPEQSMSPEKAYKKVHNELSLDGRAQLNLASFVTTWMDPYADRLYAESYNKNLIDKDEYCQTAEIEKRCIHILADLWHSPEPERTIGASTVGSSEGCMLGGLALKRRWQNERKKQGKPVDKPNIVFSSAVQIVWKKFANYWDIEPRYVNISPDHPAMNRKDVISAIDENTIGVVSTFGATYTGLYEPIDAISKALDELKERSGLDIPIHVDAASGGFIAPFLQPDLIWDFQLPRVKSINVSGHKYGLVYPGIGWVIWREAADLPEDLIFHVSYLGGDVPTLGLNFSRPSAQVLLQYYNFIRLGKEGYYKVQKKSQEVAHFLSISINRMEPFEIFTDGSDIPVVTWRLKEGYTSNWNLNDLARHLRIFGWQVPAYSLPPDMEEVTIMRVVVRNEFSMDMAHYFLNNLKQSVSYLDSLEYPLIHDMEEGFGFHHEAEAPSIQNST